MDVTQKQNRFTGFIAIIIADTLLNQKRTAYKKTIESDDKIRYVSIYWTAFVAYLTIYQATKLPCVT